MPGWHTIIRGLAPQAGGFRRRSNRIASVGLSAWLIVVNERLPCVLQVVAATCSSVSYLNTCQTCNPGSDPVASHAQYITNRIHGNAFGDTEAAGEKTSSKHPAPRISTYGTWTFASGTGRKGHMGHKGRDVVDRVRSSIVAPAHAAKTCRGCPRSADRAIPRPKRDFEVHYHHLT